MILAPIALGCIVTDPEHVTPTPNASNPSISARLGDAPPTDTGLPLGVPSLALGPDGPIPEDRRVHARLTVTALRAAPTLETGASVEERGASSAMFPKRSFNLELQDALRRDRALPLLGMPPEADWVLHGPYADKTALRNALAYALARATGRWAPRARFAELAVGRRYEGLYVVLEKPELDPERVDLPEPTAADPSGAFLFKLEGGTDGGPGWTSAAGTVYELHDPGADAITDAQRAALIAGVDAFEASVLSGSLDRVDVESFVDFTLIQELARNVDAYRRSTFLALEPVGDGGRVRAGPVWDFDIAFGNANFCDGANPEGLVWEAEAVCEDWDQIPAWWHALLAEPRFRRRLRCRWEELREGPFADAALDARIDALAFPLRDARARDEARWRTLGRYVWPNAYVGATWSDEIGWLRTWLLARASWLDGNLPGVCPGRQSAP